MQIYSDLALTRPQRLEQALAVASTAADFGYDDPVRRRGKTIGAYAWAVEFPTKREAKYAARKLRQWGYGKARHSSADRRGRFYMSRARRRLRDQQDALRNLIWERQGPPF